MRGRLWAFVGLLVIGFAVAGCVAPIPSVPATQANVLHRHAVAATTSTTVAPSVPSTLLASTERTARPASVAAPSPWSRFDAVLSGSTYLVAHAHARGAVPVAAVLDGAVVTVLPSVTRIGAPRVFLVVADEGDWLQVLLPLRPNGSLGWIRRSDVDVTTITQRIEIDRAAHRMRVFDGDSLVMDEPVAVGRAGTPTPSGQFFVTELIRTPNPGGAYGPFAFTLSAYSNVYQRFGSGDGAVGLHGTNEPRAIGTDVSHGCVRVPNDAIRRLASMLPLGTPVVIR